MKKYPKETVIKIREQIFKNSLAGVITPADRDKLKRLYIFEGKYFKENYILSVNLKNFADCLLGCGYLYSFLCGINIKTEISGNSDSYKVNIRLMSILLTLVLRETMLYGSKMGVKIKDRRLLIYTDFKIKNKVHLNSVLDGLNALRFFSENCSKICVPISIGTENLIIKNEYEYYKNPFSVFNIFIK